MDREEENRRVMEAKRKAYAEATDARVLEFLNRAAKQVGNRKMNRHERRKVKALARRLP